MYLVNHFVVSYAEDKRIHNLMDNLEFVLVPFVNPDGYVVGVVTNLVSHDTVLRMMSLFFFAVLVDY